MTAVKQLWIARVVYIIAVLLIYAAFAYDLVAGALCFGGCVLMWLAADGHDLWSVRSMDVSKRFDDRASEADAFSKGEG